MMCLGAAKLIADSRVLSRWHTRKKRKKEKNQALFNDNLRLPYYMYSSQHHPPQSKSIPVQALGLATASHDPIFDFVLQFVSKHPPARKDNGTAHVEYGLYAALVNVWLGT